MIIILWIKYHRFSKKPSFHTGGNIFSRNKAIYISFVVLYNNTYHHQNKKI